MNRENLINILRYLYTPQSLTTIVAILVTVVVTFTSIIDVDSKEFNQALLVVIGLLASGQLIAGYSSALEEKRTKQIDLPPDYIPVTVLE